MMYQLPTLMIASSTSTPRAMLSDPRQSASRPYGFSTSPLFAAPFAATAGVLAAAALAAGAAGACAVAGSVANSIAAGSSASASTRPSEDRKRIGK